jgi:hypothetical protein
MNGRPVSLRTLFFVPRSGLGSFGLPRVFNSCGVEGREICDGQSHLGVNGCSRWNRAWG